MQLLRIIKYFKILTALLLFVLPFHVAAAEQRYSPNMLGTLGLNTIPNARFDPKGTMRLGLSTQDPYLHSFLGFQVAEPLYISLRQTAEISGLNDNADRLYPGINLKLRLKEESAYWPEIALGLNSAFGHKRMASEYLSFSKRFYDLDLTAGMAWGRLGSAAHIKNPLSEISNHFGKRRALDGEDPNDYNDWFTGEDIGFFAGLEYFTPLDGLSLKMDWGADRYAAERAALDFEAPAPWSVGLNYQPKPWVDFSLGTQGGEKVMARLNLQNNIQNWPLSSSDYKPPVQVKPGRQDETDIPSLRQQSQKDDVFIQSVHEEDRTLYVVTDFENRDVRAKQIGRTMRHASNHAGQDIETIAVLPRFMGLNGPEIRLNRRDFEQYAHNRTSANEIWMNAEFEKKTAPLQKETQQIFDWRLISDHQISLAEEDTEILRRNSLILETKIQLPWNFFTFQSLRLNYDHNLERLRDFRARPILPVRSDVDIFAERTLSLEQSNVNWFKSFNTDLHAGFSAGVLEEMYGGFGGEVLFRPFGKTFALGAEAWQVFKIDPFSTNSTQYTGDSLLTGHVNAWYEVPNSDLTLKFSLGRYLAEDLGGTFSVQNRFSNGTVLEGFATYTDQADQDLFGDETHLYSGLRFRVPIGSLPFMPSGSEARAEFAPFGRDNGQALRKPFALYDLTDGFSYRRLSRDWGQVLD